MKYAIADGKVITIPDAYIEKQMRVLELTRQEAVEMYLSDEGITPDSEVVSLTAKAKAAGPGVGAKATGERKERKAPVRQPDQVKRAVIAALAEFIESTEHVTDVEITNVERMIAFAIGGDHFEVTLTKKRPPKK
jgi:hypothetical protein